MFTTMLITKLLFANFVKRKKTNLHCTGVALNPWNILTMINCVQPRPASVSITQSEQKPQPLALAESVSLKLYNCYFLV